MNIRLESAISAMVQVPIGCPSQEALAGRRT